MSNASDVSDAKPPYRSFEELRSARMFVSKSDAAFRLFWSLDGPFPEAISVMKDRHSPLSLTPYFSDGTFHPISQESISAPKISSVIVSVLELDTWEDSWETIHDKHDDGGLPERWFGTLDDYDPEMDIGEDDQFLLGCCGEPRPIGKEFRVVVRPASGDFVTVHDYISTVHPWLMDLKGDIESARDIFHGENGISDLMVSLVSLGMLSIEERSHWIKWGSRVSNQVPTTALAYDIRPVFGPDPQPELDIV